MGDSAEARTERHVETLAAYAHNAWAGWLAYMLHERCIRNDDGSMTIPRGFVERWERQLSTAYEDLPEAEKESDRNEARAILEIIGDVV